MLNTRTVNNLYRKLNLQIPTPKTELLYKNNFQLLISVILTAQTTDKIVNLVTPILFNKYPDPRSIIKGGEKNIAHIIRKIGLAPTKTKNIIQTCRILLKEHEGKKIKIKTTSTGGSDVNYYLTHYEHILSVKGLRFLGGPPGE